MEKPETAHTVSTQYPRAPPTSVLRHGFQTLAAAAAGGGRPPAPPKAQAQGERGGGHVVPITAAEAACPGAQPLRPAGPPAATANARCPQAAPQVGAQEGAAALREASAQEGGDATTTTTATAIATAAPVARGGGRGCLVPRRRRPCRPHLRWSALPPNSPKLMLHFSFPI